MTTFLVLLYGVESRSEETLEIQEYLRDFAGYRALEKIQEIYPESGVWTILEIVEV